MKIPFWKLGWAVAVLGGILAMAPCEARQAEPQPAYPGGKASDLPAPPLAPAPVAPTASSSPVPGPRTAAELETLAAPIALYPDPLIALILPASVYPVEVVLASRFVKDTNNLPKLAEQPWDEKVKEVAKFPDIIAKMDADLAWTTALGRAFVEQPMDLMNAIQALRSKAQSAGTLKSNPQQVVLVTNSIVERTYENQVIYVTNTVIQVQPASPEVIYVPSYNPSVVYVTDYAAESAAFVSFGVGMFVGAAVWGNCDWNYGGCYWGYYPPPPPPLPPPYYPPPGTPPPPPGGRPPGTVPPGLSRPPGGGQVGPPPPGGGPPPGPGSGPPRPTAVTGSPRWQPDPARLGANGVAAPAYRPSRTSTAPTTPSTPGSSGAVSSPGSNPGRPTSVHLPARGYPGSGAPANSTRPTVPTRTPGSSVSGAPAPPPSPRSSPSATPAPANRPSSVTPAPSGRPGSSAGGSSVFDGVKGGSSSRDFGNRGTAPRSSSPLPPSSTGSSSGSSGSSRGSSAPRGGPERGGGRH